MAGRAAALALTLSAATQALAQPKDAPALSLSGRLTHPHVVSVADLSGMAKTSENLPASGHAGDAGGHVTGVKLWPLLDQAGWVDQPGRKTHLQHVVLARGRDGYAVALAIAELDPALEGKDVLIVTDRDGRPTDRLDLFVPGDKRAARQVHDLVGIEVQ